MKPNFCLRRVFHLKKGTVLRHLIEDDPSIGSNDEIPTGGFHHLLGDNGELVSDEDEFDLHHQTLNETKISFRDAKNGSNMELTRR
jgi:hypothetical protein